MLSSPSHILNESAYKHLNSITFQLMSYTLNKHHECTRALLAWWINNNNTNTNNNHSKHASNQNERQSFKFWFYRTHLGGKCCQINIYKVREWAESTSVNHSFKFNWHRKTFEVDNTHKNWFTHWWHWVHKYVCVCLSTQQW